MCGWTNVPRSIGARLQTIATTDATILIHEDNPVLSLEGSAHGTDLGTGRIVTMVAELRDEETP
jgi:hypothetical protein